MSGHYDQIRNDAAFRKDVVNRCGVGFDVAASLASIEPNEPKIEDSVKGEIAVMRDGLPDEKLGGGGMGNGCGLQRL